ncbi:BamA/TamA family outer membrane protein [Eisenibacter elegans]|uniref:BamA/TamA family outer membrane protein n=1 Tax=Eisenibacter elegans TaxID=997 RepID=UPI00042373FF|nr:BamA/TamA family outer membrane protein [Eisenibacter elegans]
MFKQTFLWLLCGVSCLGMCSVMAQDLNLPAEAPTDREKNLHFIPLPVLYYAPETSLGFGALASFNFKIGDDWDNTRTSNVRSYLLYTLNQQLDINAMYTLFSAGERYLTRGQVSYSRFPEFFYGVGNDLSDENEELVDYRRIRLEHRLAKQIFPHFFVGAQYRLAYLYDLVAVPGGMLEGGNITGSQGYTLSGLGLAAVYDTRDNILNPTRGVYLELSHHSYLQLLGSTQSPSSLLVDLRKYVGLFDSKHVLAFQGFGFFNAGDVPFKEMGEMGGTMIMRGYYNGRYRAPHHWAVQAEYRAPVVWRLGLTGWAGLGDVSDERGQLRFDNLKPNYGAGLRFMIDTEDRVNIRLDYGFGHKGISGFYLDITEAF